MSLNQKDLWKINLFLFDVGGWVKRIQYYLFKPQMFSVIKKNVELLCQDKSQKKVFVCGLGPSLKEIDLMKLKGDTLVVNRFYKIGEKFPSFIPTYYILIDYKFIDKDNLSDLQKAIDMYVDKGTKYILNSKLANSPYISKIPSNQVYFVSCIDGRMHVNSNYKIDGVYPAFQNVVGAAIFLLMLMGYKEINLLGCDFNSFASAKQNHCYDDKSSTRLYPMYEELFAYSFAAKDHSDLQQYALKIGCQIVNRTRGSLIDAYHMQIDNSLNLDINESLR